MIIGHTNAPECAESIKSLLEAEFTVKEILIMEIGPIIGSHVGAGMFALTFVGENYKF